jgi:hypothetical protein
LLIDPAALEYDKTDLADELLLNLKSFNGRLNMLAAQIRQI